MVLIIFFNGYLNLAHAVIPDDVHVLDNSDTQTNKYIIQLIDEAWHTSVYGALKIYTDATGSKQLEQSFVNNTFWYIGTKSCHSNIELESLKHYVNQFKTFLKPQSRTPTSQTLLSLDQHPKLQQRIFNFSYCKNAHLKFLLTWDEQKPILLLGTTTGDCVERDYHDNLIQHWYGTEPNNVDFMVVIRSPYLISQFTRHLINYLPDKVAMSVKQAYENVLSTIITPDVEDLKTEFAWSPEHHRQQLLDLINDAEVNIKILQQDLIDPSMQQALRDAAHKGIKIQISCLKHLLPEIR